MAAYEKVTWRTHDGTRYVESIMSDGHPAFRVTDPRHIFQDRFAFGIVRIVTRTLPDGSVVFADLTVAGLRRLGVELDSLEPVEAKARPGLRPFAPVTRRPGESVADLNQRRYRTRLAELLADIGQARGRNLALAA